MEEDEQRRHELMEALLNGSLDPALLVDGNGKILMVNSAVATRLGKAPKDLIGASLHDLFPSDVADARLGIVREAIRTGQPVRYQDGHFGRHFDSLVSPVRGHDGRMECVAVYSRDVTNRHQMDQEILNASTRERQRLGSDLHDRLGQQLTGIRFLSAALAGKARERDASLAADAARIEDLVTEAMEHVRRISRGVAPVGIDDSDLEVAVRQLAVDTEELFKVSCVVSVDVEPGARIDGTVATELYWIAAEAVSNAVRHGHPSRLNIALRVRGDAGSISVRDNGSGLPEKWESSGGMGVRIMRYRASVIGAKMDIESANGDGTTVTCLFNTRLTAGHSTPGGNPMPLR